MITRRQSSSKPRWRRAAHALLTAMLLNLAALAGTSVLAAPEQEWSAAMFGSLPTYGDVEISPDARRLALLQTDGDSVNLVIRDLDASGAPARASRMEGVAARGLYWAGNETVLVLASQTLRRRTDRGLRPLHTTRWLAFSVDTLKATVLFGDEPGYYILSSGSVLATPQGDDRRAVFARWTMRGHVASDAPIGTRLSADNQAGGLALFSVDLGSGKHTLIAAGSATTTDWHVAASGQPLVRVDASLDANGEVRSQLHVQPQAPDSSVVSRSLAKALATRGKPVEMVELPGGDHWLLVGATRTQMLQRSIVFIDQHIGKKGGNAQ